MSKTVDPTGSWSANFRLLRKDVLNSQFSMPEISSITEMLHLKLIYVADTRNV
jgi:hypothetical protein